MNILIIIGLIIGLIIIIAIVAMAFIAFDLMSYAATGSETLNPAGSPKGNALIVYSPGLSGAGKEAAGDIAEDLKSKGYKVDLAGVRSKTAANTSGYDIIIAGGPMYWGKVSKSVDTYMKTLNVPENVKVGVFGTTGSTELHNEDIESLEKQVSTNINRKAAIKTLRSGEATKKDIMDFDSAII